LMAHPWNGECRRTRYGMVVANKATDLNPPLAAEAFQNPDLNMSRIVKHV